MSLPIAVKVAHTLDLSLDYLFLGATEDTDALLKSINATLKHVPKDQSDAFLKTIKILRENINKM